MENTVGEGAIIMSVCIAATSRAIGMLLSFALCEFSLSNMDS